MDRTWHCIHLAHVCIGDCLRSRLLLCSQISSHPPHSDKEGIHLLRIISLLTAIGELIAMIETALAAIVAIGYLLIDAFLTKILDEEAIG